MATLTYDTRMAAAAPARQPARRNLLVRFLDAFAESRMRQAQREINRYRHLLPYELEQAGDRIGDKNEHDLPFVR